MDIIKDDTLVPKIESTPTLEKLDMALFIYEPNDGYMPILKVASILPGSRVWFSPEEMKRLYPE